MAVSPREVQPKILIVYGKAESNADLREILEPVGYDLLSAGSGRRAIEMCEQFQPDLLLLSTLTRDLEGLDVCRQLKKEKTSAHIPVILYSSKQEASHRMRAYGAGVDDTLLEPFEKTELLAKVAAHLKRSGNEQSSIHLAILNETNTTKDRLLRLFSRVNHLLSDVLTARGSRETITTALASARDMTGSDCACLASYDSKKGRLTYDHFLGMDPAPKPFAISFPHAEASALYERRLPVVLNDYATRGALGLFKTRGAQAFAGIPVGRDGELLGLLCVFRMEPNPYQEREEEQLWALGPVFSATILKSNHEAHIARMITQDSLTGLLNWHHGMKALQHAIAANEKDGKPVAAARIDLANLRELNEVHGFAAGDAILTQVGHKILKSISGGQMASRSGKKFLLILPGLTEGAAELLGKTIFTGLTTLKMQYKGNTVGCVPAAGWAAHNRGELLHAFYMRLAKNMREDIA